MQSDKEYIRQLEALVGRLKEQLDKKKKDNFIEVMDEIKRWTTTMRMKLKQFTAADTAVFTAEEWKRLDEVLAMVKFLDDELRKLRNTVPSDQK